MKTSVSQIIAIACILTIGFIGLFSLATKTDAHYLRIEYTHTHIECFQQYMVDEVPMLSWCNSFTRTRGKHIYPSNHYTESSDEEWNHNAHAQESNTDADAYDNEYYPDCGWCTSEKKAAEAANAHHPPPPDE